MAGWKPDIREHIGRYIFTFHFLSLPNNDARSEYDKIDGIFKNVLEWRDQESLAEYVMR